MNKVMTWAQSKFRDRYKVRRYPSNHFTYFKTRRGAVKYCVDMYNGWGGDFEMYKLYKSGHTAKVPWF